MRESEPFAMRSTKVLWVQKEKDKLFLVPERTRKKVATLVPRDLLGPDLYIDLNLSSWFINKSGNSCFV